MECIQFQSIWNLNNTCLTLWLGFFWLCTILLWGRRRSPNRENICFQLWIDSVSLLETKVIFQLTNKYNIWASVWQMGAYMSHHKMFFVLFEFPATLWYFHFHRLVLCLPLSTFLFKTCNISCYCHLWLLKFRYMCMLINWHKIS